MLYHSPGFWVHQNILVLLQGYKLPLLHFSNKSNRPVNVMGLISQSSAKAAATHADICLSHPKSGEIVWEKAIITKYEKWVYI